MLQPKLEDPLHVVIGQGVINVLAIAPRAHKVALAKDLKLVRNGRRAHAQQLGKVRNAQLALVQSPKHLKARAVPEHFEEIRKIADILVWQQSLRLDGWMIARHVFFVVERLLERLIILGRVFGNSTLCHTEKRFP